MLPGISMIRIMIEKPRNLVKALKPEKIIPELTDTGSSCWKEGGDLCRRLVQGLFTFRALRHLGMVTAIVGSQTGKQGGL